MIKRIVLPALILAAAIIVFVMMVKTKAEPPKVERPEKVWLVNAVQAKLQTLSPEITIYGRVETPRDATLSSALQAEVVGVDVLEGDIVQAGQTLIRLDDTDSQLLVAQRQADVDEINAQISSENDRYQRDKDLLVHQQKLLELDDKAVSRAQKLEQSRLASKSSLDDALAAKQRQLVTLKQLQHDMTEHPTRIAQLKATMERAQALLKQAHVDLSRTVIKAPFSGRVAKLDVAVGDRVRVGDSLLAIYDLQNLEVRAQIPGRYINQVQRMLANHQNLQATAQLDDKTLQLNLHRLSGAVRQDSGGIDGLFTLNTTQQTLPLGTFVELHLKLSPQPDVVALPFTSVYGLNKIYRIKDGYLQSLTIHRVGEIYLADGKKQLLVKSPELHNGDQIISTQLPNAINGLRVEVRQ